ncbi:hypothetical protein F4778DRAFT_791248 [Xylariomycetidae sp. FL2044]|nr:hypothetical protein F4778DRAFT_791248 [Xylariomycetidae sp. FL2044]
MKLSTGKFYHKAEPKYAPFAQEKITVDDYGYKPRDLLKFSIKSFYQRTQKDRSTVQDKARIDIINKIKERRGAYDRPRDDETNEKELQEDVMHFIRSLDEFFFHGSLEEHLKINTGFRVAGIDPISKKPWHGESVPYTTKGKQGSQMTIDIGDKEKVFDILTILGNLMHEMVHAWFQVFSCDCEQCNRAVLNTIGLPNDGHGPHFLMLHALIVQEMRRWDPVLSGFLEADCPEGRISKSAESRAKKAMGQLTPEKRAEYTRVRSAAQAKRDLIRITANSHVYVDPRFKLRQLMEEDQLLSQQKRDLEADKDMTERGRKERETSGDSDDESAAGPVSEEGEEEDAIEGSPEAEDTTTKE